MADPATKALLQVARDVLSELDVDEVLGRALASAQALTGARYAALGVLDEGGEELARFLTVGTSEEEKRRIGPLPTGHGVLGELIRNPEPLRLADVSAHHHAYGFPGGHPLMRSFLGVPIFIGGHAYGNLYLTEKEGAPEFSEADEDAIVMLAEFAGLAIDHARRYAGSEASRRALERNFAALDATVTIARTLAAETDLETILGLVAKRGRALVSARALVIELLHGPHLVVEAAAGELPPGLIGARVDAESSVAGAALRMLRPERLETAVNRARYDEFGLGRHGLAAEAGLVVPLVLRGRAYGALVAVDRQSEGPEFSAEDEELLEAFAASAATAVATAQRFDAARRRNRLSAGEAERARWARELHDETLQGLGALRMSLAAMEGAEPTAAQELIQRAIVDVETEIEKLSSLITDLRPMALDELGIGAALESLADRLEAPGLEVKTQVDHSFEAGGATARYEEELETAIYRIAQEALDNTVKHAKASVVVVEVVDDDDRGEVRVSICDDGGGFDPSAETTGLGLNGMRERVELLGGSIEICSAPGEGVEIQAVLPSGGASGSVAKAG
ncbi:MAG TPA: GAF domain-containing sensor histidine kinase [Solirubrobacterales bacterium]|nr:GAF domain-containing sensor histidine kinase [Solirubrobacterales bacterium]